MPRRLRAATALVTMSLALAGCAGGWMPEPPAELRAAAEDLASAVHSMPNVTSADAAVRSLEDWPGSWWLILRVEAEDANDLFTVPAALRERFDGTPKGFDRVDIQLTVPGDDERGAVRISDLGSVSDAVLEAADVARGWNDDPSDVGVGPGAINVSSGEIPIGDMIRRARDEVISTTSAPVTLTFHWDEGGQVGDIAVTRTQPDAELTAALETIRALPDVSFLSASADPGDTGTYMSVEAKNIERPWRALRNLQRPDGESGCVKYSVYNSSDDVWGNVGDCD